VQPHIKLIKMHDLQSVNKQIAFYNKYKGDELFTQLVLLSTLMDFKFKTVDMDITLQKVVTTPTHLTFTKFRNALYKYERGKITEDKLVEIISSFDSPTAFAYSIIVGRKLLITYDDITSIDKKLLGFTPTEYYTDFGYPTLPCYVQLVPHNWQMVNIVNYFGITQVMSVDGTKVNVPETLENEVLKLKLPPNTNISGYLLDDTIYCTNYYIKDSDSIFSERFKVLELMLLKHNLLNIRPVPCSYIETDDDLINIIKTINPEIIDVVTLQDTTPAFSKHNNIKLDKRIIKYMISV